MEIKLNKPEIYQNSPDAISISSIPYQTRSLPPMPQQFFFSFLVIKKAVQVLHLEIEKRKITSTSFEGGQMLRPPRIDMANTSVQSVSASERKSKSLDAWLNVVLVATAGLGIAVYLFPIFSPELYAPTSTYRFGTVKAGTPIKHTFTLRNLHPWPVTVTGITSDCGCTKTFVGRKVPFTLYPFQAVDLVTTVDTGRKSGSVSQNINIKLNNRVANSLAISGNLN